MAKSLNKAMLIGNLTRDPEMRYTPQGLRFVLLVLPQTAAGQMTPVRKKKTLNFITLSLGINSPKSVHNF
jgi:single-stranded DNA-binding protein